MDVGALSKLTHGLYVLGAKDGERYVGCIVDAVMQASLKPPLVAVSCLKAGYTQNCIRQTNEFSLSVLGRHVDPFVLGNFGYQSSRTVDKWAAVPFVVKDNLPFYQEAISFLTCHVIAIHEFETHVVFMAEVMNAWQQGEMCSLTYNDYQNGFKTKVKEAFVQHQQKGEQKMSEKKSVWVCTVCGYVYDGDVPFEELPDTWTCPLCGVGKELFEKRDV